jgi:hypothetical protein
MVSMFVCACALWPYPAAVVSAAKAAARQLAGKPVTSAAAGSAAWCSSPQQHAWHCSVPRDCRWELAFTMLGHKTSVLSLLPLLVSDGHPVAWSWVGARR